MPGSDNEYLEEIKQVWKLVLESFSDRFTQSSIKLWFGDLVITDYKDGVVTMEIKSELKYGTLKDKYIDEIERRFSEQLGFDVKVNLVFTGKHIDDKEAIKAIMDRIPKSERTPKKEELPKEEHQLGSTLPPFNFEYTFDNFIVGNSNKFAHAASFAVANQPAKDYNPLFIYGPSGLGKTHLLYAITNRLRERDPDIKVIYIKSEDFTNQMIDCLSRQSMNEFRDKYRKCDVLLIDDVQFIAGKISTQEEFFHTFNALYEDHKQIILTSDRQPRDIKTLEDRLKTRFEWGLIADIQPPDLELRIAIIKAKAEQVNVQMPDDVLTFLAENLRSNIRQIEGAIKKLGALSFLSGKEITMDVARGCISELLGGAEPISVTVDKIFASIYQKYNVKKEDLISNKRTKEIAFARHVCIYLIRDVTEMSLPNIGKLFNRDHSTIMNSIDTIERRLITDSILDYDINEIKKEVTPT